MGKFINNKPESLSEANEIRLLNFKKDLEKELERVIKMPIKEIKKILRAKDQATY